MSSKLHVTALAALLGLAAIAPAVVHAQSITPSRHAYRHQYQQRIHDFRSGLPRGARASSAVPRISAPQAMRPFETDPDARIRFEMNRDDRDRRLGGS